MFCVYEKASGQDSCINIPTKSLAKKVSVKLKDAQWWSWLFFFI